MSDLIELVKEYLGNGGFFNPELMDHEKVRDMVIQLRDEIERLEAENKDLRLRLAGVHGLAISMIIDCELVPGIIPDDEKTGLAEDET